MSYPQHWLLVYFKNKYTFSLHFMSEMGFMYSSEMYLKLHLRTLDLYFKKV